jgi:hypothetical protein
MRFLAIALAALLAGCDRAKQDAATAVDEARLSISSATRAGVEPPALAEAARHLQRATSLYSGKQYPESQEEAKKAHVSAVAAEAAYKEAASPPIQDRRPKPRRKAASKRKYA